MTLSMRTHLCLACIEDADLGRLAEAHSVDHPCSFCENPGPSIAVTDLAACVDKHLREALKIGGTSAHFSLDSDSPQYGQDGDELEFYVQDLLGIALEPALAVVDQLIQQDPADPSDGDEPFYSEDQLYQLAVAEDWEFSELWDRLAATIKHGHRFFSDHTREDLARILGESGSQEATELPTILVNNEGTPPWRLFRARHAANADEARTFLLAPERELSPPPTTKATPSRMNPTGISVFYGALSEEVALAEVRPPVGGIVVVAEFVPTRGLRLLDLTGLRDTGFAGSIFSTTYRERVARARFLRGFHTLIAQPIQPHDESLEYLPTQVVAEYVRNVLGFDGILFASAQVGALNGIDWYDDSDPAVDHAACNIVIFGRAVPQYDEYRTVARITGVSMVFPLTLVENSAHGILVRQVSYLSHRINLDDERGEPPPLPAFPSLDL